MYSTARKIEKFFLDPEAEPKRAFAFFLALALAIHLDKFLFGPFGAIRFHDVFDHPFSRITDFGRYFREFGLVEWYPAIAGGLPLNADQTTLFHPLVYLVGVFPAWLIHNGLVVALAVIAGYGFYRLVTEFFGFDHPLALLGAILFFMATHFNFDGIVFNVFIFAFPMIFVLLHSPLPGKGKWGAHTLRILLLVAICLLSFPFLGLIKFTALHAVLLLLIFYRRGKFDGGMVAAAVVFWAGYGLLFLPNFFALLDYLPYIQRVYTGNEFSGVWEIVVYFFIQFPVVYVFRALIVDHYLFFSLFIAAVGLVAASRMTRAFFWSFVVLSFASAFFYSDLNALFEGTLIQKLDLHYIRWTLPFAAILFITAVIKELPAQSVVMRKRFLGLMFGSLGILVITFLTVLKFTRPGITMALIAVLIAFFAFFALRTIQPETWRFTPGGGRRGLNGALAAIMLVAACIAATPVRVEKTTYAEAFGRHPVLEALAGEFRTTPFRVAMVGLHPTQAQMHGLETFGGKVALVNRFYKDYAGLVVAPQFRDREKKALFRDYWYHLLMSEWDVHPRFTAYVPSPVTAGDWNLGLLAAANIRYIVAGDPIPGLKPSGDFPLPPHYRKGVRDKEGIGPVFVYPVPGYLPRGYLVAGAEILANRNAVLARLSAADSRTLATTAFLAEEDAGGMPAEFFARPAVDCGEAMLSEYRPDRLVFDITALAPCLLVVTNNFDSKWMARLDGESVMPMRANHAFFAVPVAGPGRHELELVFNDPRFPAVLAAVPVGALIIALAPWAANFRRRNPAAG